MLVNDLKEEFGECDIRFDLYMRTYSSDFDFSNCTDVAEKEKEICLLENERRKTILILETYPKNSNEYKKEIKSFLNKLYGKNVEE